MATPPQLISPAQGEVLLNEYPIFTWENAACKETDTNCALNYIVYIDDVAVADITENTFTPLEGMEAGVHSWFIKSQNHFQYNPSEVRSFTVRLLPEKPILIAPTTTQDTSTPVLQWTSCKNADTYTIELAYDSDFENNISIISEHKDTSYTVSELENGIYYWRVTAYDVTKLPNQSEVFVLEIGQVDTTTQICPESAPTEITATSDLSDSIQLTWTSVANADGYLLYRYLDDTCSTMDIGYSIIPGTSTSFSDNYIEMETTYYYNMAAVGSECTDQWAESCVAGFQIACPNTEVSNIQATDDLLDKIQITWDTIEYIGSTDYTVYRYTALDCTGTVNQVYEGVSTPFDDTTTASGDTFCYSVSTHKTNCSEVLSTNYDIGHHQVPCPDPPTGLNFSTCAPVTLSWSSVSAVDGYEIFRSEDDIDYSLSIGTTSDTTFEDSSATEGVTYYYKVRSLASGCTPSVLSVSSGSIVACTPHIIEPFDSTLPLGARWTIDTEWDWSSENGGSAVASPPCCTVNHTMEMTIIKGNSMTGLLKYDYKLPNADGDSKLAIKRTIDGGGLSNIYIYAEPHSNWESACHVFSETGETIVFIFMAYNITNAYVDNIEWIPDATTCP